jgi:uncharacterized GH25 family protein
MRPYAFATLLVTACGGPAMAHDTWVEINTNLIRTGDAVHVDLKLGNHGNEHRDFKLASKVELGGCTLDVIAPDGRKYDLTDRLVDTGYAPKEGYWTTKFAATSPGLYVVAHALDRVVNHGRPVRSIKSAKAFFVVSTSLDRVPQENPGFDRALGHPLELLPTDNPVTPMGPGTPIAVKLLYKGQPLAGERVSFIPRGETLSAGFDERYERRTDVQGRASFTPTAGNVYLVVAHRKEPGEATADYDSTSYSATLTVFVPEVCPCCGE